MRLPLAILACSALLAGCQTSAPPPGYLYAVDQHCVDRRQGSQLLGRVAGFSLGIAGVPGGGLIGSAVGMAADPRCQEFIPVAYDPRYPLPRRVMNVTYVDPVPKTPPPPAMGYGEN
jgi:hypothetical protein